jgi:hypothetical protein
MAYNTVEALIENDKILSWNNDIFPKYKTKVLITFIEDFDLEFRELDNSELSSEIIEFINETKKIPKELLCDI